MYKQAILLATGVLTAGLLAAGCGGDDSGATAETPEITKAVFVRKANAICKATSKDFLAEAEPIYASASQKPNYDELATNVKVVSAVFVPALQDEVDEIKALGSPKGDEDEVSAILGGIEAVIGRFETNPAKQVEAQRPYASAEALTDKYGLTDCPYG